MSKNFDICSRGLAQLGGFKQFGIALICAASVCQLSLPAWGQGGSIPPPPGLVAWWSGDGDATDLLGINNGLVYGATFTTGMVGQAFYFDGSGAKVVATALGLPAGNDDRTIEFWARLDTLPTSPNYAFLAGYGAFGQNQGTFEVGTTFDGSLWWSQWGTGVTGPQLQAAQWNHLAVTSQGGTVNLYVNGSLVASGPLPFNTPTNTSFFLGAIPPWTGVLEQLQGALDEISVYNRALSDDEILAIYQAGSAGKTKPGPQLKISSSGGVILVWWPTSAGGFILETSSELDTNAQWSAFNGPVTIVGDQNLAVISQPKRNGFFRLRL